MRAEGERSASMPSPCHSLDQVVAEILQIVADDKTESCRSDDRAEYFFRGEIQKVWAFKPLMNNPRIRNQGGLFLAFGCRDRKEPLRPTFSLADYDNPTAPSFGIAQAGFVRIAAKAKADILEQLRMFGMTEEGVYPELSDVCKTLDKRFRNLYPND